MKLLSRFISKRKIIIHDSSAGMEEGGGGSQRSVVVELRARVARSITKGYKKKLSISYIKILLVFLIDAVGRKKSQISRCAFSFSSSISGHIKIGKLPHPLNLLHMCLHKYTINPEEFQAILSFVNEEGPMPSFDTLGDFQAIYFALQRKLAKQYEEQTKKCFKMERRLERIDRHEERQTEEGVFAESGLDSLEVADVLLYHLQELKVWKFTKNKFMSILFHMYASWLGSKKERICLEHPVATEWGPQFWRVYKRLNLSQPVSVETVKAVRQKRADITAYIANAARKYYDCKENELSAVHLKCDPYKRALPHNNGGKWNKEISDSDIFLWMNNPKM